MDPSREVHGSALVRPCPIHHQGEWWDGKALEAGLGAEVQTGEFMLDLLAALQEDPATKGDPQAMRGLAHRLATYLEGAGLWFRRRC